MDNKFSQNVMARLEQEVRYQKKRASSTSRNLSKPAEKPPFRTSNALSLQNIGTSSKLSDYLQGDLYRRRAKSKTLYLDEDLIHAIDQAASDKGISVSHLVNHILRTVVGI